MSIKKNIFIGSVAVTLFVFSCKRGHEVPTLNQGATISTEICGRSVQDNYIILYKENSEHALRLSGVEGFEERGKLMTTRCRSLLSAHGLNEKLLRHVYHSGVEGFSARMNKEKAAEIRQDPSVELVERDKVLTIDASPVNIKATTAQTIPWGVQRVGFGSGTGKTAWIIDTGIDMTHPDLNVDILRSKNFIECKNSPQDDNGHGTHVAGIIGAKDNDVGIVGVAAGTSLVALKALDDKGSGAISDIILALDWVSSHGKPGDVINMSLGGMEISPSLDKLVYATSLKGIYITISAGNESCNTDTISPARVNSPFVFTVSAMNSNDGWASFSNFGSSVDACSPGVNIFSTYLKGQYATMNGTSMAAPHVAGLLLLDGKNINYSGYVKGDPDGKADPIAHE
jgi:subtilisin family serine protease